MEENFKEASLNTYLLLKEAQNISEQYYKQGQLETLNKIIEELHKQEREGFKTVQIFKIIKEFGDGGFGLQLSQIPDRGKRTHF